MLAVSSHPAAGRAWRSWPTRSTRSGQSVDVPARRPRARRSSALRELTAEHGERALRALGGRRAAERLLAGQDPGASTAELVALLERGDRGVTLLRQIALLIAVFVITDA